jgi:hypothetical protein
MTRFVLEIEIGGDLDAATGALNAAIDADVLQDHIKISAAVFPESMTVTKVEEIADHLTRFTVEAAIDGNRGEASEALDDALDAGVLQEFIKQSAAVTVERAVVADVQEDRRR